MKHHQKTEVNEDTYLLQETTTQEKPTKVIKKTYEPITDVKPALLNHLNDVENCNEWMDIEELRAIFQDVDYSIIDDETRWYEEDVRTKICLKHYDLEDGDPNKQITLMEILDLRDDGTTFCSYMAIQAGDKLLEIATKSSPSYIPRLELIEFLTQDTYRKRLE